MIQLDENLLNEIGLGELTDQEKETTLEYIYQLLESRIDKRLTEAMSEEQLKTFDEIISKETPESDEKGQKWLEENFPKYKEIVTEEFEQIRDDIKANASQIMAADKDEHK